MDDLRFLLLDGRIHMVPLVLVQWDHAGLVTCPYPGHASHEPAPKKGSRKAE